MKRKKEIATLDAQKHTVKFPTFAEQLAFSRLKSELCSLVVENLEALTMGEAHEATRSWDFDETTQEFFFEISVGLNVEVQAEIEEHRTKVAAVHATFSLNPLVADLPTVIEMLDDKIRRFKAGLGELRKLQLQRVLTTDGREAYDAACRRSV